MKLPDAGNISDGVALTSESRDQNLEQRVNNLITIQAPIQSRLPRRSPPRS